MILGTLLLVSRILIHTSPLGRCLFVVRRLVGRWAGGDGMGVAAGEQCAGGLKLGRCIWWAG